MAARMSISRFSYLVSSSWKQQANSKSMMSKAMKHTRNYCSFIPDSQGCTTSGSRLGDGPHEIEKSSSPKVVGLSDDEVTRIIKEKLNSGWRFGDGPHGIKKSSWPEVVGLSVDEATRIIKQDMPTAWVVVVPRTGCMSMTCDTNYGRVRLFLDYSGKVFSNPIIG